MGAIPGVGRDECIALAAGAFTATGGSEASLFSPSRDRAFNITLRGTFVATVALQRSFDAGANWDPVTYADGVTPLSWTAPVSAIWSEPESGVIYRLYCTWTSGTVTYRLSQ